jgi:hypothetical protein
VKLAWFNPVEKALLLVLSGFVFWANAVPSITLILLLLFRILQAPKGSIPSKSDLIQFALPIIILVSWAAHGFASDGGREIQLWLTWIAAFFYFKTSPLKIWFLRCFRWISLAQAVVVFIMIVLWRDFPSDGYSHYLRDAVETTFRVHPTFLSTSWLWAALLFYSSKSLRGPLMWIPAMCLVIMAVFMGGKMPVLAFVFVSILLVFKEVKGLQWKIISATLVLAMLGFVIYFTPVLSERVNELQHVNLEYQDNTSISSTDLRIGIWQCAWQTTQENWITGVGIGNTREVLDKCFEQYNSDAFFAGEYNSHNQFLHTWLSGGIAALILSLSYWLWMLYTARWQVDKRMFFFLIFFLLVSLTENYFSRQFGMMFCSFMLFALWNNSESKRVLASKI